MRFCFKLACAVACAAALQAAPAGREKSPASAVTSVVRTDPRTGKLVRKVVQLQTAGAARVPSFQQTVERIAAEQSVPPELIHSVIQIESGYNPYAVSPKGALGLMQLIPSTARRFGVADVFDPAENIQGGARYLKYLLDLYRGNRVLALAAYNAGEGAVARYGDVPPFPETRHYVSAVGRALHLATAAAGAVLPDRGKEVQPVQAPPAGPSHIREVVEADGSVRYVTQ
ncbi:MAG: lytic transglycosylase domain-containing protein [Bryobacteraceae bacterium]|jgi:soluble lytic murein transglycosylase-like protein